jgi:hypothetical protein
VSVHAFPQTARQPAAPLPNSGALHAPAPGGAQAGVAYPTRDVGLGHIARRLGRPATQTVATTIGFVRELIRCKGFPEPLGFRRFKGELMRGAEAVTAASRWPTAAVEAWFDHTFPGHAEAALAGEEREWAGRLDNAAALLGEVA